MIEQLKKDIAELEAFRRSLERQQVTYPFDKESLNAIHKDVVIQQGEVIIPHNLVDYNDPFEVSINGKIFNIESTPIF